MDRLETQTLLNKITVFRQSFLIQKDTVSEWLNVLEPYAYEDVVNRLTDFFKDSTNFGKYPDPYCLSNNLTKIVDKSDGRDIFVRCQICQDTVPHTSYAKHFDRCSSVDYLERMAKKHFDKTLNKQKLKNISDDTFDNLYWNFCNKLYENMTDEFGKKLLENAILSHDGKTIRYAIDDIVEEMKGR